MQVAYFDINFRNFDDLPEQVNELVDARKFPHIPQLVSECEVLWCLRGIGVDHLVVGPLSRHDGKDGEV